MLMELGEKKVLHKKRIRQTANEMEVSDLIKTVGLISAHEINHYNSYFAMKNMKTSMEIEEGELNKIQINEILRKMSLSDLLELSNILKMQSNNILVERIEATDDLNVVLHLLRLIEGYDKGYATELLKHINNQIRMINFNEHPVTDEALKAYRDLMGKQ